MTAREFHRFEKVVHRAGGTVTVTRRFVVEENERGVEARIEEAKQDGPGWRTIRQWTITAAGVEPAFPEVSQA